MLLRKTAWFRKRFLVIISSGLIFSISGCSNILPEETAVSETVIDVQSVPEESEEAEHEIISLCIDLYEKAEEENKSEQSKVDVSEEINDLTIRSEVSEDEQLIYKNSEEIYNSLESAFQKLFSCLELLLIHL